MYTNITTVNLAKCIDDTAYDRAPILTIPPYHLFFMELFWDKLLTICLQVSYIMGRFPRNLDDIRYVCIFNEPNVKWPWILDADGLDFALGHVEMFTRDPFRDKCLVILFVKPKVSE